MTKITLSEYFPSMQDRAQNSLSVDSRNVCKHLKDKPPIGKAVASVFVLPSIMLLVIIRTLALSWMLASKFWSPVLFIFLDKSRETVVINSAGWYEKIWNYLMSSVADGDNSMSAKRVKVLKWTNTYGTCAAEIYNISKVWSAPFFQIYLLISLGESVKQ